MRRFVVVAAVMAVLGTLRVAPAGAETCDTPWGSTRESNDAHPDATVVNVRAGQHACFDRFVVVLDGPAAGYDIRYVKTFVPDARGRERELRGAATLRIVLLGARAHDDSGEPTYQPRRRAEMVNLDGFRTLEQAYWGGTFEGTTTIGLGVRARLPFRVTALEGPGDRTRMVFDIAHRW